MSTYKRWLKSLMKVAAKLGWLVLLNGHVKLKSPEGPVVCCSSSPTNPDETIWLVKRDLKRAGFPVGLIPA